MKNKTVQYILSQRPDSQTADNHCKDYKNRKTIFKDGKIRHEKNHRKKKINRNQEVNARKRFEEIIPEHTHGFIFVGNKILRHCTAKIKFQDNIDNYLWTKNERVE